MENKTQNTVNFIINLFLKVLLAVVAVALLLYSAGGGIFAGSLFSLKRQKPAITIENTPMTIQDVRAVGKLVTASFYDEMIIKRNKQELVNTNDGHNGEIVIIQKAHVRIGVDLTQLRDEDIQVEGESQPGRGGHRYGVPHCLRLQTRLRHAHPVRAHQPSGPRNRDDNRGRERHSRGIGIRM